MSPSQHMGLPILCTPPRVSVDPGSTILMSWNSASHQLTIFYFMIKYYWWNSRMCPIFHFPTCSSRRSSQSFWFATTWTSLFGPLRPITHCPQKSPFPFIPVLLPSDCQILLAFFSLSPKFPRDWAKDCCSYTSSTQLEASFTKLVTYRPVTSLTDCLFNTTRRCRRGLLNLLRSNT